MREDVFFVTEFVILGKNIPFYGVGIEFKVRGIIYSKWLQRAVFFEN